MECMQRMPREWVRMEIGCRCVLPLIKTCTCYIVRSALYKLCCEKSDACVTLPLPLAPCPFSNVRKLFPRDPQLLQCTMQ